MYRSFKSDSPASREEGRDVVTVEGHADKLDIRMNRSSKTTASDLEPQGGSLVASTPSDSQ